MSLAAVTPQASRQLALRSRRPLDAEPQKRVTSQQSAVVVAEAAELAIGEEQSAMPGAVARELRALLAQILVADFLQETPGDLAATVGPVHRPNPRQEEDA